VLDEDERSSGSKNPLDFLQCVVLVGDRAQRQGGDDGVEAGVVEGESFGGGVDNGDARRCFSGGLVQPGSHVAVGLRQDQFGDRLRVETDVPPVPAPTPSTESRSGASSSRRQAVSPASSTPAMILS
jgi:hypothetical protein